MFTGCRPQPRSKTNTQKQVGEGSIHSPVSSHEPTRTLGSLTASERPLSPYDRANEPGRTAKEKHSNP
jgi:hypothetical protein